MTQNQKSRVIIDLALFSAVFVGITWGGSFGLFMGSFALWVMSAISMVQLCRPTVDRLAMLRRRNQDDFLSWEFPMDLVLSAIVSVIMIVEHGYVVTGVVFGVTSVARTWRQYHDQRLLDLVE